MMVQEVEVFFELKLKEIVVQNVVFSGFVWYWSVLLINFLFGE